MRLRRLGPVLLVALLVVLAGCSGSGGQPYQTPLNASQLEENHSQALQDAGNFTYRLSTNATIGDDDADSRLDGRTTVKVDTDSDALLVNTSTAFGTLSVYQFENGTSFLRLQAGDRVQYARQTGARYNASQFTALGVGNLTTKVNFTYNRTTTLDGETVYEYVARENGTLAGLAGANASVADANVTSTLRFYVRPDGLVKRYQYRIDYDDVGSMMVTGTYTKLGSTDVSPPTWVDEARANTTAS